MVKSLADSLSTESSSSSTCRHRAERDRFVSRFVSKVVSSPAETIYPSNDEGRSVSFENTLVCSKARVSPTLKHPS